MAANPITPKSGLRDFINGLKPENLEKFEDLKKNGREKLEQMSKVIAESGDYWPTVFHCAYKPGESVAKKLGWKMNYEEEAMEAHHKGWIKQSIIGRLQDQKRALNTFKAYGLDHSSDDAYMLTKMQATFGTFFGRFNSVGRTVNTQKLTFGPLNNSPRLTNHKTGKKMSFEEYADTWQHKREEAIDTGLQLALFDYLYYKPTGKDSFVKQYIEASKELEKIQAKKFKVIEQEPMHFFVEVFNLMAKKNKDKGIKVATDNELKTLYDKYYRAPGGIKEIGEAEAKVNKTLKVYDRPGYPKEDCLSYISFCLGLHKAKVIDLDTFEDMAFKAFFRRDKLEQHLNSQPEFRRRVRNAKLANKHQLEEEADIRKAGKETFPIFLKNIAKGFYRFARGKMGA